MEIFSPIMGASFRGARAKEILAALPIGPADNIFFEAEPHNEYDASAVKVLVEVPNEEDELEKVFCGYLARGSNFDVAEQLQEDASTEFSIEVVSFESAFKPLLLIRW